MYVRAGAILPLYVSLFLRILALAASQKWYLRLKAVTRPKGPSQ